MWRSHIILLSEQFCLLEYGRRLDYHLSPIFISLPSCIIYNNLFVQELKRDIHGLIAAKTNLNLAEVVDYGGKTFLSDDVAIMLIQVRSLGAQLLYDWDEFIVTNTSDWMLVTVRSLRTQYLRNFLYVLTRRW